MAILAGAGRRAEAVRGLATRGFCSRLASRLRPSSPGCFWSGFLVSSAMRWAAISFLSCLRSSVTCLSFCWRRSFWISSICSGVSGGPGTRVRVGGRVMLRLVARLNFWPGRGVHILMTLRATFWPGAGGFCLSVLAFSGSGFFASLPSFSLPSLSVGMAALSAADWSKARRAAARACARTAAADAALSPPLSEAAKSSWPEEVPDWVCADATCTAAPLLPA